MSVHTGSLAVRGLVLALILTLCGPGWAADYLGSHSREFRLTGKTLVEVSAAAVRRLGADKAVEQALEEDNRYYNLIHFVSSHLMRHHLPAFCRGTAFQTKSVRPLDGTRFEVTFEGLIGGPLDMVERMEKKGMFRSGRRFTIPFPADVSAMSEHDWYEFDPDAFDGELVQVPVSIQGLENVADAYPDYARLFEDDRLTISIFYGFDGGDGEDPGGNDLDVSKAFYEHITQFARRYQFSDPLDESFGRLKNSTTFTRTMLVDSGKGPREVTIELKIFYRRSPKVKYHFRRELKTADVVIYDGHSAYGGGFQLSPSLFFANPDDTAALDREMNDEQAGDRYQIYFVNACHSYGYYADMFYDILRAKHPGNLDIVTTVNPAGFADSVKTDVKMINLLTRDRKSVV